MGVFSRTITGLVMITTLGSSCNYPLKNVGGGSQALVETLQEGQGYLLEGKKILRNLYDNDTKWIVEEDSDTGNLVFVADSGLYSLWVVPDEGTTKLFVHGGKEYVFNYPSGSQPNPLEYIDNGGVVYDPNILQAHIQALIK